jgi:endonuclease/exonuclease/phosphatase family metal-dependent hydrolase
MCSHRKVNRLPAPQLLLMSAIMLVSSITGIPQRKSHATEPPLESGRAETILSAAPAKEIKIVSYNIRWRSGEELQQIVQWLKTAGDSPRATIIGLQEVDRARKRTGTQNHAKVLADSLGMYYAWAAPDPAKGSKQAEEETGVELLSSYPLEDITRIVLTTDGPGNRSRVALGATVRIDKLAVRVYSVHGETRLTMGKKVDQFKKVLDDLAKFPKLDAAIVVGDFNSWEPPAIERIRGLFTEAGFTTPLPDDESTFLQNALLFDIKLKLDWIWVRGLTPQAYGIDRKLKVSDHFPLWTVVRLPEGLSPARNASGIPPSSESH